MNKKKGITLVEVVVAMAIVIIVSVMVFSTCSFALKANEKSKKKNFFVSQASNYINCYYLGPTKYSDAMELLTGDSYAYDVNANIYYSKNFEISSEAESAYVVKLTFQNFGFLVECYESQNLIYKIEV